MVPLMTSATDLPGRTMMSSLWRLTGLKHITQSSMLQMHSISFQFFLKYFWDVTNAFCLTLYFQWN